MKDETVYRLLLRWGGGWTTKEIDAGLRAEERERVGPGPLALIGGVYIPTWKLYVILMRLVDAGRVTRRNLTSRTIEWTAVPDEHDLPITDPRQEVERLP